MPRRFAYSEPDGASDAQGVEAADTMRQIGPLVAEGVRPGGRVERITLNPDAFGCRTLVRQLGWAWLRQASSGGGRYSPVRRTYDCVVTFARFVDEVNPAPAEVTAGSVDAALITGYETMLAAKHPSHSAAPGYLVTELFAMLRNVESDRPGILDAGLRRRMEQPPSRPNNSKSMPIADFSPRERLRLIEVARITALQTEMRVRKGAELVATAGDPRVQGWGWPNIMWLAAKRELTVAGLREGLPGRWWKLSDELKAVLPARVDRTPRVGELVRLAYRHVYPHSIDLMGHYVLLALDTGAPPECLKDLTEDDCEFDGELVRIRLVKHRAHRIGYRAFGNDVTAPASPEPAGGTAVLPATRFRDAGSVLRSLIRVTEAVRRDSGSAQLFSCAIVHPRLPEVWLGSVPWHDFPFKGWVERTGLDQASHRPRWRRGEKGQLIEGTEELCAVQPPYDLRRLRKANRAHLATTHPSEFHAWGDNELQTFQRHYTRSATVFQVAAGRLFVKVADSLAAGAKERRLQVVAPSAVAKLAAGDAELAGHLGVDAATAVQIAAGGRDVDGGIAACIDPLGSPFVEQGRVCDVARLGMCLRCPMAVVTPRHAGGLARFDAEHLERLRHALSPEDWAKRGQPTRSLVREVLRQVGHEAAPA